MKLKNSIIVLSIFVFFFIFFNLGSVNAQNITFSPGELVNITGIKCLEQNNTDCSNSVGCNISIIYQNNTFLISNQSMEIHDAGFRSYNTGLSPDDEITLSAVVNCDNGGIETFNIVIEYDKDLVDIHYGIYGLIVLFGLVLGIYGFKKEKFIYVIISGMAFLLCGLNIIANGFPNIDNQYLTGGIGIILIGVGASFIVYEIGKIGNIDKKAEEDTLEYDEEDYE